MDTKIRIAIEKRIVKRLVNDLIAAGYWPSVVNDDEGTVDNFTTVPKMLEHIFNLDECRLSTPKDQYMVYLVFGNDGFDVISDYSIGLEHIIKKIQAWAENAFED